MPSLKPSSNGPRGWVARVAVGLKPEVLDPQGKTVRQAAVDLGFRRVKDVRVGKYFWITLDGGLTRAAAEAQVKALGGRLLVNPVIEGFTFTLSRR